MNTMAIVPTYNERDNIERLLEELLACQQDLQVVVVDDNSPDGTGAVVDAWVAQNQRVHVVHRAGKLGLGTAYIAGFKYALAHHAERIITMDADFSHNPRFIPRMLQASTEADVVIGSRYISGGGTLNCSYRRRLLSRGANLFAKTLLSLQARDCTAGFRCYRSDVLHAIKFESIYANGYSYLIEMLAAVQSKGYLVAEIPILFEDRRFGTSKISSDEIWRAIGTVLRLFTRNIHRLTVQFPGMLHEDAEAAPAPTSTHLE